MAAFVPEGFDAGTIPDIRWMGLLAPQDKLSPRVLIEGGEKKLLVFLHRSADVDKAREAIQRVGGELLSPIGQRPTLALVRGNHTVAEAMAGLDEVSYIYKASDQMTARDLSRVCAGAMTPIGPVAEFVINSNGWDGPGHGSASLLYHFVNGTPDVTGEKEEVRAALDLWAKYVAITWSETVVPNMIRSIDISWASGNHGDGAGSAFDGENGVLAHCFYPDPPVAEPRAGDLHFDEAETWRVGSDIDLFTIALHEIGHGLGLGHSDVDSMVMSPSYFGPLSDLREDDIQGIRSIYALRVETRTEAPAFLSPSGTYPSPLEVRLVHGGSSTNANTLITYTLDGSEPTPHSFASVPGSDFIFLRDSKMVRARAFREGRVPSPIVEANYVLTTTTLQVADPVITPESGNYIDSVVATISTVTADASIRFTTDGSEPTSSSTLYTGPLTFKDYTALQARAFRPGYVSSQRVSAVYFVTNSIAPPAFFPTGGAFSEPVNVTMSSATPGASIRYTRDGSTPTVASTLYTGAILVSTTDTVKARAFVGASVSSTSEAIFVIAVQAAIPTITPNGGNYSGSVTVTLATSTPGATIRYTTNNTDPNATSQIYTAPFTLGVGSFVVRARAYLDGIAASGAASAYFQGYSAQVATTETPTLTPSSGQIFVNSVLMTMDFRTEGAVIRYTVGMNVLPADPTEAGPGGITYTDPVEYTSVGNTLFFKVRAFKTGRAPSQLVQTGGMQVVAPLGTVETPTITPHGGTFNNPVQVTLATPTQFAQLVYTDDDTQPSTVIPITLPSRTYSSPFTLNSSKTIRAKGYRTFFEQSPEVSAEFEFTCAVPVIAPVTGAAFDSLVVTFTTA
ncbi:MAG TPA: chitobiase/beta-hexosaminidase C-terminal domain-containing protein, partial [Bacteroidota bacterium]|nr:chitobiase/beta-hexosaminidase C-terminal domain-containing protein [Bacteroidota bacterium]